MPTGSSDPFALRRAALGVVKIILERKLPLSLAEVVAAAARGLTAHPPKLRITGEIERQVMDFLLDRARYILRGAPRFCLRRNQCGPGCRQRRSGGRRRAHLRRCARFARPGTSSRWPSPSSASARFWRKPGPRRSGRFPPCARSCFRMTRSETTRRGAPRGSRSRAAQARGQVSRGLQGIAALRPEVDEFFDSRDGHGRAGRGAPQSPDAACRAIGRVFDDRGFFRAGPGVDEK